MKNLLIIIFLLAVVIGNAQSLPGTTQYLGSSNTVVNVKGWIKPDSGLVTPNLDTTTRPRYLGEIRFKVSDSVVYIGIDTATSHTYRWMALNKRLLTTSVSGVSSVGTSIGGSVLSITGGGTGAVTLAHVWNGAASDIVLGNGTYSPASTVVRNITDALYSTLGHTHSYTDITNFTTGVRQQISVTAPLNYSQSTGVISLSGSFTQDGLISGGVVTWSGSGLVMNATAATYVIGGQTYTSPTSSVTLDAADPSFPRYDAIIVNTSGAVSRITGTPAASPILPQADPADELVLTYVYVDAGATTPTLVSDQLVYDENVEWTGTASVALSANFASGSFAQHGSVSTALQWAQNANVTYTNGSNLATGNYSTLSFYVRLGSALANNQNITVTFLQSGVAVSNAVTTTFSKSTTGSFQLVSLNLSQFTFTSTTFNAVRFTFTGSSSFITPLWLDYVRLQAGITPPTTTGGLQAAYARITDGTNTATSAGSDVFKIRTDNTLSAVVTNNDATHGDNVLIKADTTVLATKYYVSHSGVASLQQVTDVGSTTTNSINVYGASVSASQLDGSKDASIGSSGSYGGKLTLRNGSSKVGSLYARDLTADHDYFYSNTPNSADTIPTLYDVRNIVAGGGISAHGVSVLKNYYTQSTSTGGGTTDDITIVNVPANTLSNNGDVLVIEVAYKTTGSDTKSVDLTIGGGSTIVGSSSATTAANYIHRVKLMRTSSTNAAYRGESYRDNSIFGSAQGVNTSFDWTTSQDIKVHITSTTAASITINFVTVRIEKE